jgi:PBSX family phage terminase large subunit
MAKYRLYIGGFGSGKTYSGCQEALKVSQLYPGSLGVIARFTYPELRDTTRRTFFDICPPQLIKEWRSSENHLKLTNGSEILFRTLDDPDKLKSLNLDWFYIDEGSETNKNTFEMLRGRLRGLHGPRKGWVTSNPAGHDWLWEVFERDKKNGYEYFRAPTTENIHLPQEYIEDLLNSPDEWKKRYVFGSWDCFEGQIYDMFTDDLIVPNFRPAVEWEHLISVDHGYTNPTAAIFGAVDYDGTIWIYEEYYQPGKLVSYHAHEIRKKVLGPSPDEIIIPGIDVAFAKKKWENKPIDIIIDPSTKNRNPIDGQSVQAEYADNHFVCINGNNEVLAGINRVGEYFNSGKLKICKCCTNLIDELKSYKWDDADKTGKEKPVKTHDHAVDALRYMIMSRPMTPKERVRASDRTRSDEVWQMVKNRNKHTRDSEYLGEF